jgi:hypothetical protein
VRRGRPALELFKKTEGLTRIWTETDLEETKARATTKYGGPSLRSG